MSSQRQRNYRLGYDLKSQIELHGMMLPGTILVVICSRTCGWSWFLKVL